MSGIAQKTRRQVTRPAEVGVKCATCLGTIRAGQDVTVTSYVLGGRQVAFSYQHPECAGKRERGTRGEVDQDEG